MKELFRRIWYLCNRRRLERELSDEMAYHRELMRADGHAEFGSELRLREDTREIWGWTWFDRLHQDLVYAARMLRKSPGFTFTAVLVLGLGIAVPLTALRAVLAAVEGGAVPDPATLVHLTRRAPGVHITSLPYPALAFYTANARSFRNVIGVSDRNPATFGEAAEPVHLGYATANYFPEFGIAPLRGRLLTAADERADAPPAALVTESFWQRRLGGDSILGQPIRVNGKLVTVVGVIPTPARSDSEIWIPFARQPYFVEGSTLLTGWNSALDVYGRLRPGISPQAAEQESRALAAALRQSHPDDVLANEYLGARPVNQPDENSQEAQILLTAAALVVMLLIAASANLGTLVLARGVAREREIRIRLALGAARARLVRQLFTESLLLAVLSALCGLVLSSLALTVLRMQYHFTASPLPDWRILAATFAAALLSALIFGLSPALRLTSLVPRAGRSRTIFLAAQIAASALLLVVSTLIVSNLQRVSAADPGFDYRHLLSISPGLQSHGYTASTAQAYLDSLRARAASMPGVEAVTQTWLAPWGNLHMDAGYAGRRFDGNRIDPQFLDALRIPLLRGRNFRRGEEGVALVTKAAARTLWPSVDALGQTLPWDKSATVIGVVRDASTASLGKPQPLEYYLPPSNQETPESILLVRVAGNPHDAARLLQDAALSLDPRLQPVTQVLSDSYDRQIASATGILAIVGGLGAIAILLSAIGLAGLTGYTVAQRTREIGLRIALGARTSQIIRAILAPMGRPIAIGFLCGLAGASVVTIALRSAVPTMAGLHLFDPFAYLMAIAFFAAVLALAIVAPSRRALRINPTHALRYD